tara:strand:+ start:69725 stop:70273 length:549 start_codon:yes stop_codon:yes gene_type:complete
MGRFKVNSSLDPLKDSDKESILSLYNKKDDKNLFNRIDNENIKLSGSKIKVYKFMKSNDVDDVYMESRQKTISPQAISLWAHYDPRPIEENLTQFGVEVQNDQLFIFNKTYVEQNLGREIIIGDVLEPEFQDIKYQVHEVQEDSFEAYGVYHLMVHATVLRDTQDIHNEAYFDTSDKVGGKI